MGMDLIGQSLGRYHILDQLGRGGMAIVYKAYDTHLERDVALKVIRRGAFPAEQLDQILKRFEREAKSLANLSHPNILKVMDYGEHEGSPYLVLEYQPGGNLKQQLKGKPMHWEETLRILTPIASALEYAHQSGIIHRDIKPSNILLTDKGIPMLSDFGIAKILETETMETLTGTGVGVGTPEYMAPEQWTGGTTKQSDIYSLGIVLYEMITGRKPYTADTPAAILLKQATEPLQRPVLFVPDLPEDVEKALIKALALKPEYRYQNMGEFAKVLDILAKNTGAKQDKTELQTLTSITTDTGLSTFATNLQEETLDTRTQGRTGTTGTSGRSASPTKKGNSLVWLYVTGGVIGLLLLGALFAGAALVWATNSSGGGEAGPSSQSQPTNEAVISGGTELPQSEVQPTSNPPTPTLVEVVLPTLPPTHTPVPVLQGGETMRSDADDMTMVYIPMLGGFWIDQTEVTNAHYALCVQAGGCNPPVKSTFYDIDYYINPFFTDFPVVYVYWSYADAYCSWAGRRLPTSQEWEAAAQGGDGRAYPWGNNRPDGRLANTCDANCTLAELSNKRDTSINDGFEFTSPVGSYPEGASPYGVLDMAGNVWEWTATASGGYYIIRGGAWTSNWETTKSSYVSSYDPMVAWVDTGFRCAADK